MKKQQQAVNPTKQHSMKCPKLYGKECTCDGYHTFEELYEHRIRLYIALCSQLVAASDELGQPDVVWKSKTHSDNTKWDGWFIVGIFTKKGEQITYHLPDSYWEELSWIKTREKAPKYDGHTSEDVIRRLSAL